MSAAKKIEPNYLTVIHRRDQPKNSTSQNPLYYSPFGMTMKGRESSSENYRYGFNGMEKDDEWKNAKGTDLDFGARMYDSRLGRFKSTDALTMAWSTSYSYAKNSPIVFLDFAGLVPIDFKVVLGSDTYIVTLDNTDPQTITVKKQGALTGLTFKLKSVDSRRVGTFQEASMMLLKSSHSKRPTTRNQDYKILTDTKYKDIPLTRFITEVVEQNSSELGLVIVGNHKVATKDKMLQKEVTNLASGLINRATYNRNIKEIQNGDFGRRRGTSGNADAVWKKNAHLLGVNRVDVVVKQDDRTPITEAQWTLDRANFIKKTVFNDNQNVVTYSRQTPGMSTFSFPAMVLTNFGNDAVGITIFFDFSKLPADKQTREPEQKAGNPRFLDKSAWK
jgi:RHS repeat-associated protein